MASDAARPPTAFGQIPFTDKDFSLRANQAPIHAFLPTVTSKTPQSRPKRVPGDDRRLEILPGTFSCIAPRTIARARGCDQKSLQINCLGSSPASATGCAASAGPKQRSRPGGRDRQSLSRPDLSWPAGAGKPGSRADRHPQACGHRRLPAVDIEALGRRRRRRPLGVFRHRIRRRAPAGAAACARAAAATAWPASRPLRRCVVLAAAEADLGEALQQRQALLLRTGLGDLAAAGRGFRSAPGSAVPRCAACAGRGRRARAAAE